jgi:hypothetical protein
MEQIRCSSIAVRYPDKGTAPDYKAIHAQVMAGELAVKMRPQVDPEQRDWWFHRQDCYWRPQAPERS